MIFQEVYMAVGDTCLHVCVYTHTHTEGLPQGLNGEELAWMQESQDTRVQSLGQEDPLEKGILTHSSIHAWRSLWTEEPLGCSPEDWKESDMTITA